MTPDLENYRTAIRLIREFGPSGANFRVAQHVDELLAAGDVEGRGVWLRILEAIKDLSEAGPATSGAIH